MNIDFRELLLRGLKGNSLKNMRQLLGSSFQKRKLFSVSFSEFIEDIVPLNDLTQESVLALLIHPKISMHILHTVLCTSPKLLTGRI